MNSKYRVTEINFNEERSLGRIQSLEAEGLDNLRALVNGNWVDDAGFIYTLKRDEEGYYLERESMTAQNLPS